MDHVTVLIGIAVGSKAVAGVIHQPYWNYKVGIRVILTLYYTQFVKTEGGQDFFSGRFVAE